MKCQRCQKEGVSWTNDTVTLFGGVTAHLCAKCDTEWDEVLTGHPLWERQLMTDARKEHYTQLAIAKTPVSEGDLQQLYRDKEAIRREAHALGVEFVKPLPVVAGAERP